jgi:archaellum biogenesis ATPase FlaH
VLRVSEEQFFEDPTLQDPDGNVDTKYGWDEEFQRHITSLLISDRQFLLQSIDLVNPNYLTNKVHSKVCNIAFEFFKKYRILPRKDFIVQELKTQLKDNKSLAYYLSEVNVLFDYFQPGMEAREYLQDKIVFFAKIQAVKKAFHDSLKLIDKAPESEETWSKVYDGMREAMQTHQNFELGLDYFKTIQDRYNNKEDEKKESDRFILGLESVDKEIGGGGYSRGEIISIVAGSGVGKSVMLACIAATNLLRGKRGVYISLELAEQKVADRMDAILTGLPVQNLIGCKEDVFNKIENLDNITLDGDIGPLIIKQFPAGAATVNTIRAYISQLRFQGFDPDFVIVDYVGEMALHTELKSHESRERIVRELRGMATEEQIFMATAMQPNRDGKKDGKNERGRIDDEHLADSFGQIRPLDGCISLNQNDSEKLLGIGRAYVIKQRDGKSRFQIYLSFDKENLRIKEILNEEYRKILNQHKEYASEETNFDMVKDSKIDQAKKTFKPPKDDEEDFGVGTGGFDSLKEVCQEEEKPENL